MPTIDVLPSALISAAAAARCFAYDVDPVVVQSEALADAAAVFGDRWSQALNALVDDAGSVAASLRNAAEEYVELDELLVPRTLR